MNLTSMIEKQLILLNANASSKLELLDSMIDALYQAGYITSKEEYKKAVLDREGLSPTGFENGIAIPHGKSNAVKKPGFVFAKVEKAISDWESIVEDNQVDMVFLLAIPEAEAQTTHLKLLSELSMALLDETFISALKQAQSKDEVFAALQAKECEASSSSEVDSSKTILAITSCAAGIAHTYMAAEALVKAGKEKGIQVLVEKQGANGIEDRHTKEQIQSALGIIVACDIAPKGLERYHGKAYVKVKVAEPLKHAPVLIDRLLNEPDGVFKENDIQVSEKSEKKGFLSEVMEAIMTGISYMIPVIVAAGLMMGIAKLSAMGLGQINNFSTFVDSDNPLYVFLGNLDRFGGMIFKFIYPVFGAYVAYSIADRPGLVPGFIGGSFAGGLHFIFWNVEGGIPSGFLGAIILGVVAGYVARFLNEKIKLSKNLAAMKPMLLIPGIAVLVLFVLNFYFVDPVFGGLNHWLQVTIKSFGTESELILVAIIAACTAFDLGGPVNKAAGAIAIGLAADAVFPLTGRVLAIVIPPIGLGVSTVIDRVLVGRHVYDEDLRVVGGSSIILGLIAVSEGAIPFMLRNPLITIPINVIGAILGACTAVALGAVQWNPLPAVWGWPLVENLWAYIVGLLVGVIFIAVTNVFVRYARIKKLEKQA